MAEDKFTAYEIAKEGLMLSSITGEPINTARGVIKNLKSKLGVEKKDGKFVVSRSKLEQYNKYVKQKLKSEEELQE